MFSPFVYSNKEIFFLIQLGKKNPNSQNDNLTKSESQKTGLICCVVFDTKEFERLLRNYCILF